MIPEQPLIGVGDQERLKEMLPGIEQARRTLASARFKDPNEVSEEHRFEDGHIWVGRSLDGDNIPIGFRDNRHVLLCAGTREGKGSTFIGNNLMLYPGSALVIDPKGENAVITAARRGDGSEYCEGMGQKVYCLDPYSAIHDDKIKRHRLNPLDLIDPNSDTVHDDAGLVARWMIVQSQEGGRNDFWDLACYLYLKAIILHVLTSDKIPKGKRNLITVHDLAVHGDTESHFLLLEAGEKNVPSAHELLYAAMIQNRALDGDIRKAGADYMGQFTAKDQFYGLIASVATHTEFLASKIMRRNLEVSDFDFSELKTDPKGVTIFLTIPSEYYATHFRWLRMMVNLAIKRIKGTPGKPASKHPVLFLLDEFIGLQRMEQIERGVAELAGYGVKFLFVVQNLGALKEVYKDNWELFLNSSGLWVFFGLRDNFSLKYISENLGETEVIKAVRSVNISKTHQTSSSETKNASIAEGETTGTAMARGGGSAETIGGSHAEGRGGGTTITRGGALTEGTNTSIAKNKQRGRGESSLSGVAVSQQSDWSFLIPNFPNTVTKTKQHPTTRQQNTGNGITDALGSNESHTENWGKSKAKQWNETDTENWSKAENENWSKTENQGKSLTRTLGYGIQTGQSDGVTQAASLGEQYLKTHLSPPDEIRYELGQIPWEDHPHYPGVALIMIAGRNYPFHVRRCEYFRDDYFTGLFDPLLDHEPPPKLYQLHEIEVPQGEDYQVLRDSEQDSPAVFWQRNEGDEITPDDTLAELSPVRVPDSWKGQDYGTPGLPLSSPVSGILVKRLLGEGAEIDGEKTTLCAIMYNRRRAQLEGQSLLAISEFLRKRIEWLKAEDKARSEESARQEKKRKETRQAEVRKREEEQAWEVQYLEYRKAREEWWQTFPRSIAIMAGMNVFGLGLWAVVFRKAIGYEGFIAEFLSLLVLLAASWGLVFLNCFIWTEFFAFKAEKDLLWRVHIEEANKAAFGVAYAAACSRWEKRKTQVRTKVRGWLLQAGRLGRSCQARAAGVFARLRGFLRRQG